SISPVLTTTDSVTVCASQLPYIWNGNSYDSAGTYVDTLTSATACDTVATLVLTISPVLTTTGSVTVCASQLPYIWNGNSYDSAGVYTDTLTSATACDTVATLVLTISPVLTTTGSVTVCASQLPYIWNGNSYDSAGVYTDTLTSATACDTVATLVLTISPVLTTTGSVTVCASQLPYIWNGNSYDSAGVYTDTLTSATACDTVATLVLTISPVLTTTDSVTVCASQLPYIWNGNSYDSAGTYVDTLTSATACDTVATLVLTISPVLTTTDSVTVCASQLPYIWNGNSYD